MTEVLVHPSELSASRRVLTTVLRSRELAVGAVLVALIAITTAVSPSFLFGGEGWRNFLVTPSILVLLAVGQTVVIVTRNVDLSVGSTLGLTAYLTGQVFIAYPSLPYPFVFLIGLAFGGMLGVINGVLVAVFKVPALVITLGTLYIFRGIFLQWAGKDRVYASDLPDSFLDLGTGQVLTIPVLTIGALAVLAAVGYYMHTARGGRELYAIGSDPDAAHLYGLPVKRRSSGPSCCAVPSPVSPGSSTPPATERSAPGPAATSSSRRSQPRSSAVSRSSVAAARSGVRRSAPSCSRPSGAPCRAWASTTSGSAPSSAR